MIRDKIKKELAQRGWAVTTLSENSGVRYASISEYLSGKREISSINLEKILKTLDMSIEKKQFGNRLYDYKKLVDSFDGKNIVSCETEMEIPVDDIAAFFLGILVKKAGNILSKQLGKDVNYGDIYQQFVQKESINKNGTNISCIDIPGTIAKRNFTLTAAKNFSRKEKNVVAILALWQYEEGCDREYLDTQFLGGLFSSIEFED